VHEHIRLGEQPLEHGALRAVAQVQPCTALAQRHLRDHAGLVPPGRIDPQHIGAETGKTSRRHRSGQDTRQIEHPYAPQGSFAGDDPSWRRTGVGRLEMQQRLDGDRLSLGMNRPLSDRPHGRGASAALHDGGLERIGRPARDGVRDARLVGWHPKRRQRHVTMMWRIGMEADPSVRATVVAGDRIPGRRHGPALRTQRRCKPHRRQAAVDAHARAPAMTQRYEVRDRHAGHADCSGGQIGDREDRSGVAFPDNRDIGGHIGAPAQRKPNLLQQGDGRRCSV